MKKYPGLIKFITLLLLIFVPMVASFHYSTTMKLNADNIERVTYLYGTGSEWSSAYHLSDKADIEAVTKELERLQLKLVVPRKVDQVMVENELEILVSLWYEDTEQSKNNEDINIIMIMNDGRIVLNDAAGGEKQYKAEDITALQSILEERASEATIGGFGLAIPK